MQPIINNDLYLMLGPSFDSLHIRRSNQGQKGFEEFAWSNLQRMKDADLPPDNWMFHYRFTPEQIHRLPGLDALRSRDYFRNLLPELLRQGITPRQILPLDRALKLYEHEQFIMQPLLNHPDMPLSRFLPVEGNILYDLSLARPSFNAYLAVKTCQGVLLFSPTKHGAGLLRDYMQQTADHFFDVQMPQTALAIYQLPAFDAKLRKYADRFPRIRKTPLRSQEPTSLPPEAFAPHEVLKNGMEVLYYNLTPTWENFYRLVFPASRTGLDCSQRNHDITRLLYIANTGVITKQYESAPGLSPSYTQIFEAMQQDHATPAMLRQKASLLLDNDFGAIRGREQVGVLQAPQESVLPERSESSTHRIKF